MTQRIIPTWALALALGAVGLVGYLFIGINAASAATLYWVGTNPSNFNTASDWNATDPGGCNAGGGDAGAAPTDGDDIVLDADCDTGLEIDGTVALAEVASEAGYTGTVTLTGDWYSGDGNEDLGVLDWQGGTFDLDGQNLGITSDYTVDSGAVINTDLATVYFAGDGSQSVDTGGADADHDFYDLSIVNTDGMVQFVSSNIDVDNDLTVATGVIVSIGNRDLTVAGDISNSGTIVLLGTQTITATNDTDSGVIRYYNPAGSSAAAGLAFGNDYYSVQFADDDSGSDWTLDAALDVDGDLILTGTSELDADGNSMTIAGDLDLEGTFTHSDNEVTLDGTGTQEFTDGVTFYDLIVSAASSRTVVFPVTQTVTIANSIAFNGSAGAILYVESGFDNITTTIALGSSTATASYTSPSGVTLTGQTILCVTCTNRGFSDGWIIPSGTSVAEDDDSVASVANILSPSSGDRVVAGSSTDIEWSASYEGLDSVALYYSIDNGANWTLIEEGISNSGTYDWDVPEATSLLAKVRVIAYDADGNELIQDSSNNVFVIEEGDGSEDQGSSEDEDESEEEDENEAFSSISVRNSAGVDVTLSAGGLFRGESLSGVYLVNTDGSRWVFPTEHVFNSYGYSFDNVVTLADDQLMKFRLGGRVVAAPGELIKIQSDNRVFEVQDDGVLRHVPSEVYARENYGDNWNQMITDINVLFWGDYTIGDPLE